MEEPSSSDLRPLGGKQNLPIIRRNEVINECGSKIKMVASQPPQKYVRAVVYFSGDKIRPLISFVEHPERMKQQGWNRVNRVHIRARPDK